MARTLGLALVALLALEGSSEAKPAKKRKPVVKPRTTVLEDFSEAKSFKYGAMNKEQCHTELRSRKVDFTALEGKRGVLIPVRLTGPVHGVTVRTELPAEERKTSSFEIMDCRLALAVSDFAKIVAKHEIVEVHIFSAWRPPPKTWPADKEAIRHPGGLALDVRRLVKKKAAEDTGKGVQDLVIDRDWKPVKGKAPCPVDAALGATEKALREIFCETKEARIFTSMLSPNYDADHKNHFHLEVRPKVKWSMVL